MRTVIVHESVTGHTQLVAEAIALGVRAEHGMRADVAVVPVEGVDVELAQPPDLLVVGASAHVWGQRPGAGALREWIIASPVASAVAAAFDTRRREALGVGGSAARRTCRLLRAHGIRLIDGPVGFRLDGEGLPLTGELERARRWGANLAWACDQKLHHRHRRENAGAAGR